MSEYGPCETCGAVSDTFLIPVWEDLADAEAGESPDYIGCTECGTMEEYDE